MTPDKWTGRVGFILATIGSAIGLGSIWKFPYEVGENGGGAFVIFYLVGLAIVVTPLMFAEFAVGASGKSDAKRSIETVAHFYRVSTAWSWIGALGVITSALILSFYSVIGGWSLAYAADILTAGPPMPDMAQAHFDELLHSPMRMAIFHAIFMVLVAIVVGRGIAGGIEKASMILMPILIVLMIALAIYSMVEGDVRATVRYLFSFDLSRLNTRIMLEAVGLGFFSIGVGLAIMVTYAAYAGEEIDLRAAAFATIAGDTAISFLAGFAIFPIVFANGLDPASGPGLMFVTLPIAFANMPFGTAAGATFFILLVVAALASAISMLEMPVAYACNSLGWPRVRAAAVGAAVIWISGFLSIFSFNLWKDWFPLSFHPIFASATFFDILDYATSNILLPLGGFALALFTGWILPGRFLGSALGLGPAGVQLLRAALRYLVPASILAVTLVPFIGR